MGFYSKYNGRTAGRLLHFLDSYFGSGVSDHVIFGENNKLFLYGECIAIFTWSDSFGEQDVPKFKFLKPGYEKENFWHSEEEAIKDGLPTFPEVEERANVSKEVVNILCPSALREACILSRNDGWHFFLANDKFWLADGDRLMYWNPDLQHWLRGS